MRSPTCALARLIPTTPASESDLRAMKAAAWHKQGVLVVSPELIADTWEKALLESIGNRLYGRRQSTIAGGAKHGR